MTAPKALDAIADKVLRYRPKPKSKPARSRKRRKAKLEALRAEIQKGFDSGPAEEVGDMFERIKAEGRKRLAAKNGQ